MRTTGRLATDPDIWRCRAITKNLEDRAKACRGAERSARGLGGRTRGRDFDHSQAYHEAKNSPNERMTPTSSPSCPPLGREVSYSLSSPCCRREEGERFTSLRSHLCGWRASVKQNTNDQTTAVGEQTQRNVASDTWRGAARAAGVLGGSGEQGGHRHSVSRPRCRRPAHAVVQKGGRGAREKGQRGGKRREGWKDPGRELDLKKKRCSLHLRELQALLRR